VNRNSYILSGFTATCFGWYTKRHHQDEKEPHKKVVTNSTWISFVLVYGWDLNLWLWKQTNCVKLFKGVTESTNIAAESTLLILRKRKNSTVRVWPWLLCEYWNSQYRIHCQQNLPTTDCFIAFLCPKINKVEISI